MNLKPLISAYLICFCLNYVNCKPRMKEIVNHLTWNLIKCDSSEILWSLKNCLNVVKNHITLSDAKDGCIFLHYASSCAKQMKSKVSECEKTSKLDKSLELDSLEFLYSASYMLCKSNMADMKRIYTPAYCGQLVLGTVVNKIEAAIEMEHFVPKQAFDVKSFVCSKLREFLEGGSKGSGCGARPLKRSAQHMLDNILKCHLPYIMRRKEFAFSDYDDQQDDSFFQQFTAVSTTTTTTTVKPTIIMATTLKASSMKPEASTGVFDANQNLVKTESGTQAMQVALSKTKASKVLETLSEIINAIIFEAVREDKVVGHSLDDANERLQDVDKESESFKKNTIVVSSALVHADFPLETSSKSIKEKKKSGGKVEGVNETETIHKNDSQNVTNQLEKLIRVQIIRHNRTGDKASAISSTTANSTSSSTSSTTTISSTPSTTSTRTTPSTTTASSTPSTTTVSSTPSTTSTSTTPSTTTASSTPSTTTVSSTPSTASTSTTSTSTTPKTTSTSTTPKTTSTSTTPSTSLTTTTTSTSPSTTSTSTTITTATITIPSTIPTTTTSTSSSTFPTTTSTTVRTVPSRSVTTTKPISTATSIKLSTTTASSTPRTTVVSSIVSTSTLLHTSDESENVTPGNANGKVIVVNKHNSNNPAGSLEATESPNRSIAIEYKNRPKSKFILEYKNRPKNKFVIEYNSRPKNKFLIEYKNNRSKNRFLEVQQNVIDDNVEETQKKKIKKTKQNCNGDETGSKCESTTKMEEARRPKPPNKPEIRPENAIRPLQMNNSGDKNSFNNVQILGFYFCLILQFLM